MSMIWQRLITFIKCILVSSRDTKAKLEKKKKKAKLDKKEHREVKK